MRGNTGLFSQPLWFHSAANSCIARVNPSVIPQVAMISVKENRAKSTQTLYSWLCHFDLGCWPARDRLMNPRNTVNILLI